MHAYMYDVNEVFYLNVEFKAHDLQITAPKVGTYNENVFNLRKLPLLLRLKYKKNECTFKMPMKPFIQIEKFMTSGSGVNALG